MSDVKHTPGPWTWGDAYRGLFGPGEDNEVLGYGDYEGMWLAGYVADNITANARLIAAAPELLEALIAVVSVADRSTVEFDMARTAIAKATGAE